MIKYLSEGDEIWTLYSVLVLRERFTLVGRNSSDTFEKENFLSALYRSGFRVNAITTRLVALAALEYTTLRERVTDNV